MSIYHDKITIKYMYFRKLSLEDENNDSIFLWGVRQAGKTTLLEQFFPQARYYDLLKAHEFERLLRQPSLLSQELAYMKELHTGGQVRGMK